MRLKVEKRGDLWRVIDATTGRVLRPMDKSGKPIGPSLDHGGFLSRKVAQQLANRITGN